jgi:hypothetical protein
MTATIETAALTIDCADSKVVGAFYQSAGGGEITHTDADSCWVTLGGLLLIFREVADYQPPTWPESDVPLQMHFEFNVDDLHEAEKHLLELGASLADYQPNDNGRVMLDPAGHPFCIGAR